MTTKPTSQTFAARAAALRPQIEELSRQIGAAGVERAKVVANLQPLADMQGGTGKSEAAARMTQGPTPPGKLTFKYVPIASLQPPTHLPDGREMSLSMKPDPKQTVEGLTAMMAAVDALLAAGVDIEMQLGVYGDPAKMQARAPLEGPAASAFLTGALSVDIPALQEHLRGGGAAADEAAMLEAVGKLFPKGTPRAVGDLLVFSDGQGDPAKASRRAQFSVEASADELFGNWRPDPNVRFDPGPIAKVLAEHPEMFSDDPFYGLGRG